MTVDGNALLAAISGAIGFLLGGIFVEGVTSVLALVALVTGLTTAAARQAAVLLDKSEHAVRRATALGFYGGVATSAVVLITDAIWG